MTGLRQPPAAAVAVRWDSAGKSEISPHRERLVDRNLETIWLLLGPRKPIMVYARRTDIGFLEVVVRCMEPGGRIVDRAWSTLVNERAETLLQEAVMDCLTTPLHLLREAR